MGTTSFLLGDGKYGVFEVIKHIVPGVLCDLLVPLVGHPRRPWVWALLGGVIAAGRFGTIFLITLLVQAPAIAFAILVPGLIVHVTFGVASGWITHHVITALEPYEPDRPVLEAPTPSGEEPMTPGNIEPQQGDPKP